MKKLFSLGLKYSAAVVVLSFLFLMAPGLNAAEGGHCFTIIPTGMCGEPATGDTIKCEVGSGPSFIRVAPMIYMCQETPPGTSGEESCSNTGASVEEKLTVYGCNETGTYQEQFNMVLQTCFTAKLSGAACVGEPKSAQPSTLAELEEALSSFN